jgi:hypothetical protein
MKLTLIRSHKGTDCCKGDLFAHDGERICVTLEEPHRDTNGDGITDKGCSCIPAGTYPWFKRKSPKRGYEVVELKGVPGRTNVQIHVGNNLSHTEGCILVGSARGHGATVTGSKLAFEKLMKEIKEVKEGTIEVVDPK